MGRLELNQEVRLQNKFHVVATDIRTGKVTQEAWAYNLILNQGLVAILNTFNGQSPSSEAGNYKMMRPDTNTETGRTMRFGGYIHLGCGGGDLSAGRTKLFEFYKGYYGSYFDSGWDPENLSGFYALKATIPIGEPFPGPITEIGLASYYDENDLKTHALIEDSEGSPVFLAPGPYDQLTIYATNYIALSHVFSGGKIGFVGGENNFFKHIFVDNNSQLVFDSQRYRVQAGKSSKSIAFSDAAVISSIAAKTYAYNSGIAVIKENLKRIDIGPIRFLSSEANSTSGIREIGLRIAGKPVFRSVLPIPGVWTGKDIEDEEVDTGDGQTTVFNLKWPDIVYESEEIYVQGRSPELQARGTDYTMSDPETSEITFAVPPASGAAITANYRVDYIPKDENHVLDISFTFSFNDANAE